MTADSTVLPVIRSGDLFSRFSGAEQDAYFDTVASSPGHIVQPEALYGTNGWHRRLRAVKASPALAAEEFRRQWDSLDPQSRRELLVSNAVSRYYGYCIGNDIADAETRERESEARVFANDPLVGFASLDDPTALAALWQEKLFGRYDNYSDIAAAESLTTEGE